jgi:hypothetical protein
VLPGWGSGTSMSVKVQPRAQALEVEDATTRPLSAAAGRIMIGRMMRPHPDIRLTADSVNTT